jgi:hypothetical protein
VIAKLYLVFLHKKDMFPWTGRVVRGNIKSYTDIVSLIIPKSDQKTIADIKAAIEQVKKDDACKFRVQLPTILERTLRDGDVERADNRAYGDSYFVNAKNKNRPGIVDKNAKQIFIPNEFYSGCYGRACITFFEFNQNGKKGIACGLRNLQKLLDGEPL